MAERGVHFFEVTSERGHRYVGYLMEPALTPYLSWRLSGLLNLLRAIWRRAGAA